jgi:hypothetical protein
VSSLSSCFEAITNTAGDQTAAGIADRDADFDVQLLCFCQGAPKYAIGFFQIETHPSFPPLGALMLARKRDHNARANCRIRTHAPTDLIYLRAGAFQYRGGKVGGVRRCTGWTRWPLYL